MDSRTPLVVIVGPTASGKTALALQAARRFDGEIIAADSRTVYTGMDIGTAKPSQSEMNEIAHYCVDITTPDKPFSAAQFQKCAYEAIDTIASRGKIPILVGGTGLYVDSVIFDYVFGPAPNLLERQRLEALSTDELITICKHKGIELPNNVKNKRHIVRAIEQGGINRARHIELRSDTIVVGIGMDKNSLKERVETRARLMLASGLVEEAQALGDQYGWESEALTGNVYPVTWRLIKGEITEAEAIKLMVKADMLLIKKQMTWFRRNQYIHWSDSPENLLRRIEQFLAPKYRVKLS